MKKTEYLKELKEKTADELKQEAAKISDEILKCGFRKVINSDANGSNRRELRKNLARVYTLLSSTGK